MLAVHLGTGKASGARSNSGSCCLSECTWFVPKVECRTLHHSRHAFSIFDRLGMDRLSQTGPNKPKRRSFTVSESLRVRLKSQIGGLPSLLKSRQNRQIAFACALLLVFALVHAVLPQVSETWWFLYGCSAVELIAIVTMVHHPWL